ncbi:MAG: DUF4261 domain-containing protein [Saprospiraceae bacterium]|nr:DUF4261 domain-containing protein [Saprospiraceae bacterium]MDW8483009.1 DUF4261 domain-containing protein [Saprospiraceae bacterium]
MSRTTFCLLLLLSAATCVFSQTQASNVPTRTVSAVVLLREAKVPDFRALLPVLRKDWNLQIDSFSLTDKKLTAYSGGLSIVLQYVSYPVAAAEIAAVLEGAWLWGTAREEVPRHQAQLTIAVLGKGQTPLNTYQTYTRVAAAVLENTRAYGIYLPRHYLLLPRGFFLEAARQMEQDELPLYCWIYFGMFQLDGLSCAYTYGLDDFGMLDLEIVRTPRSLAEAHAILYDAVRDALKTGKPWQEGAILESLDGERFRLRRVRSPYIENREMLQLQKL